MKKSILIILVALVFLLLQTINRVYAQSLGLNNSTPNSSSILDAVSTTKGVLLPRMTTAQRDAIVSPATGLIVFVTDKTSGFSYYDGSRWLALYSPASNIIKRKTVDESVCGTGGSCTQSTGTTLQNDDELVIPLQANEKYVIDGFLFMIASNATPDCKIAFTIPAGATMTIGYHANYGDNNTTMGTDILLTSGVSSVAIPSKGGVTKENPILISGCVIMGNTSGNLTLQWAQNSNSSGNTVTMKTNSYLRAQVIN